MFLLSIVLFLIFFKDVHSQLGGYAWGNIGGNSEGQVNIGIDPKTGCKYYQNYIPGYNSPGFSYFSYMNCDNPNQFPIYTLDMPCDEELVYCSSQGEKIPYDYVTKNLTGKLNRFNPDVRTSIWLHGSDPELEEPYKNEWKAANDKLFNRKKVRLNIFECTYTKLVKKEFYDESYKNLPYVAKCIAEVVKAVLPWGFWTFGNENIGSVLMTHLGEYFTTYQYIRAIGLDPACRLDGGKPELDLIAAKDFAYTKDCYHACGNGYGAKCGKKDFYMNIKYGKGQPGCPPDDMECAYKRILQFIAESTPTHDTFIFYGFKCNYVNENFDYDCPDKMAVYRCGEDLVNDYEGQFALNTTDTPPLALGKYETLEELRQKNKENVYFLD